MTVKEFVLTRKIGVFELLLADIPVEMFFGSRLRVLVVLGLSAVAFLAKQKFAGEFSLRDLGKLFREETATMTGKDN